MTHRRAWWLFFKSLAGLVFALATFTLIALTLSEDLPAPAWLPFDIHTGPWVAAFLKLFGVLLVTPPAYLTLYRLALIGRIAPQNMETLLDDGHVALHLPSGFRWGLVIISMGLCGGILFALWVMEEPLGIWVFTSPLWIGAFYAGFYVLLLDGWFDDETLVMTDLRLRRRVYRWQNLETVTNKPEQREVHFDFGPQGKARVSLFLQGSAAAAEHGIFVLTDP